MTTTAVDANTPNELRADEFRAATERAAVYPDDAGILLLTGEDARDLLNRLSTNLIDPDAPAGEIAVTVLTSDRGRIVDLVYVVHCGDHQVMITSPGQQQNVIDFLDKYTIMEDLEVEDITEKTSMLRLTGPDAAGILDRVSQDGVLAVDPPTDPDDSDRLPTRYLLADDPEDAARIASDLAAAGAVSISAATAEALRIAQARPAHGSEMSDTYNPLEAGLIGAIDFHKGCYIGQEVIARLDTYHKVQKYLVSLSFDVDPAGAGELIGSRLVDDEGAAMGLVTSATVVPSPDGGSVIGLGYVRTAAVQVGGALRVAAPDGDGDGETGIIARITAQPLLFGPEKPGQGQ